MRSQYFGQVCLFESALVVMGSRRNKEKSGFCRAMSTMARPREHVSSSFRLVIRMQGLDFSSDLQGNREQNGICRGGTYYMMVRPVSTQFLPPSSSVDKV